MLKVLDHILYNVTTTQISSRERLRQAKMMCWLLDQFDEEEKTDALRVLQTNHPETLLYYFLGSGSSLPAIRRAYWQELSQMKTDQDTDYVEREEALTEALLDIERAMQETGKSGTSEPIEASL